MASSTALSSCPVGFCQVWSLQAVSTNHPYVVLKDSIHRLIRAKRLDLYSINIDFPTGQRDHMQNDTRLATNSGHTRPTLNLLIIALQSLTDIQPTLPICYKLVCCLACRHVLLHPGCPSKRELTILLREEQKYAVGLIDDGCLEYGDQGDSDVRHHRRLT